MLQNKAAERAVLSGLCRYGIDAYIEISDIIDTNSFVDNKNQLIYRVIENIFGSDRKSVDIPSINSEAHSFGVYDRICKDKIDQEYIRSLFNYPIELSSIRANAQLLAKLNIARKAQESHQKACKQLGEINGNESIDDIIKLSESPFLDLIGSINNETSVNKIGDDIDEFIEFLEENKDKSVGIHTPFPIYNHVVGDGLRPGVHLIGARLKQGKMQPYSSKVYTFNGYKTMGEIELGDNLLNPLGGYCKVVDITDHDVQDVYRMYFSDGSSMDCGLEHMVEYTTRKGKYFRHTELKNIKDDLKTTDGHYKYEIRLVKPLNFEKKDLVISPYMMGMMLGDKKLFNSDETGKLLFYNLTNWDNRFIPYDYLHSSFEDREKLYEGLMDSCGDITGKKDKIFYSESSKILDDFLYLTRSLGGYSRIMNYKDGSFVKVNFERRTKTLQEVKFLKREKCRCIKVSSDNGLYITDDFTVTHNSTIGKEVAYGSSSKNIPTLYLDTEMQKEDQLYRMLASMTKINIRKIEKGMFTQNKEEYKKILEASKTIKDIPFYHKNISGKDFPYVLSITKRWIHKNVGFNPDGSTKPHLIIYDYFKLMDQDSLKVASEHQLMGFQIAALHDFCIKYNTPVLSFVQLNRDGIAKEGTDVISQSDRLGWNAVSISLFRRKTSDEIAADGIENGNARLLPLEGRYMDRLDDGDYINMHIDGSIASIKEISTKRNPKKNTGFKVDDTNQQEIKFGDGTDFDKIGDIEL